MEEVNKRVRTDWNKLVRDKIPEILEAEGMKVEIYRVVDKRIFAEVLLSKLEEEALEASESDGEHLLEELGDIETVIDALLELKGWSRIDLEKQQFKKDNQNGKFQNRIILKSTRKKEQNGTN